MICWKCKAGNRGKERSFEDTSTEAAWRKNRYAPGQFIQLLLTMGVVLNPLLGLPTFTIEGVVLDWLHVVDLGVGQDVLGSFFFECIQHLLPGRSQADRIKKLWSDLKAWYRETKPPCQLDHLTVEMIRQSKGKSKPKLRAKGAETRYLYPFAAQYADKLKHKSQHCVTIAGLFNHLVHMQLLISGAVAWSAEVCVGHCRRFCLLYKALQDEAGPHSILWQLKPKLHLLQEMIEFQAIALGCPADFWCYRDESFCGFWAKASHRRGGANRPATTTERFLNRYRALDAAAF